MIAEKEVAMKRILIVSVIAAACMSFSSAGLSEEKRAGSSDDFDQLKSYELQSQKDECLIVAKNCIGGDEAVMKRVERLNREIEKGAAVYTPGELKSLQDQLNWIYSESGDFSAERI
jgi:hypothetical protein